MHSSIMEASGASAEAPIVESVADIAMLPTISDDALAVPFAAAGGDDTVVQLAGLSCTHCLPS